MIASGVLAALCGGLYSALAGLIIKGSGALIFRYDPRSVWNARLPASARTTQTISRRRDGWHYVVVTAGRHGALGTLYGDYTLAFALLREA